MNRAARTRLRRLWPLAIIVAILAANNFVPSYELSRGPSARQQGIEQSELTCAIAPQTIGNELRLSKLTTAMDVKAGSMTRSLQKVKGSTLVREFAPKTSAVSVSVGNDSIGNADATMLASGKSTLFRGLLGQQCQQPDTSWWFVGAAASYGRRDLIILSNPLNSLASVDIEALTPHGVIHNSDSRGIRVKPRSRRILAMSKLFPGVTQSALHITTTGGRIHAAVLMSGFATAGTGAEWLPATVLGAQRVPIPSDLDKASLFVASPTAAHISVTATGANGTFTPVGMESTSVLAGGVVAFSATGIAPDASSLIVASDVPVLVGVVGRIRRGAAAAGDFVATAGMAPSMTHVRAVIGRKETSARLILLGPDKLPARIDVTVAGTPSAWHKVIFVAAESSLSLALPPRTSPATLTLKASAGTFAATLSWRGQGAAVQPATDIALMPQETTVLVRPAVQTVR